MSKIDEKIAFTALAEAQTEIGTEDNFVTVTETPTKVSTRYELDYGAAMSQMF